MTSSQYITKEVAMKNKWLSSLRQRTKREKGHMWSNYDQQGKDLTKPRNVVSAKK